MCVMSVITHTCASTVLISVSHSISSEVSLTSLQVFSTLGDVWHAGTFMSANMKIKGICCPAFTGATKLYNVVHILFCAFYAFIR